MRNWGGGAARRQRKSRRGLAEEQLAFRYNTADSDDLSKSGVNGGWERSPDTVIGLYLVQFLFGSKTFNKARLYRGKALLPQGWESSTLYMLRGIVKKIGQESFRCNHCQLQNAP